MIDVEQINSWSNTEARAAFLRCCGSRRWVEGMAERRPFAGEAELLAAAVDIWQSLSAEDWREAFAAHPKIGDLKALQSKFTDTTAWSAGEQAGMSGAGVDTLRALAEGNRRYEEKFGYIFIVCASGKSAAEMLVLLEERLPNAAEEELRIAGREQEKITRLRLQKLCSQNLKPEAR